MKPETITPYMMRQLVAKYRKPEPEIQAMADTLARHLRRSASVLLHVRRDVALRWWEAVKAR
ncbi:MAG TPA: hypothetical protein PK395_18765 [bacterium]|nr:hypothetical protein [bacterium]HQQ00797.1 hypothetical protein [bacterium]